MRSTQEIKLELSRRTIRDLAEMICGDDVPALRHFIYRSSSRLTEFFDEAGMEYQHDGSTRRIWVGDVLKEVLKEPANGPHGVPMGFARVIRVLMDQRDAREEEASRPGALAHLNTVLVQDGYEAFYGEDRKCYVRHIATNTIAQQAQNPHRPLTTLERQRRDDLIAYLDRCSEDDLIERVLLPLFRQLGYQRITATGHKDKALEYGKDIWMKYVLPTSHAIYFGLQVKKNKLDAAGMSRQGNANVAEILNQTLMMLGHEVFDPDFNRRVLVDHAYIVAGGEITKQARSWIINSLDAAKRRHIIFMDREDIVNLFVVTSLPVLTLVARSVQNPTAAGAVGSTSSERAPF